MTFRITDMQERRRTLSDDTSPRKPKKNDPVDPPNVEENLMDCVAQEVNGTAALTWTVSAENCAYEIGQTIELDLHVKDK